MPDFSQHINVHICTHITQLRGRLHARFHGVRHIFLIDNDTLICPWCGFNKDKEERIRFRIDDILVHMHTYFAQSITDSATGQLVMRHGSRCHLCLSVRSRQGKQSYMQ